MWIYDRAAALWKSGTQTKAGAAGNMMLQDAAGAGSVSFGATSASDWWAALGVQLVAASGGGVDTTQFFRML